MHISCIVAMQEEAQPVIDFLGLKVSDQLSCEMVTVYTNSNSNDQPSNKISLVIARPCKQHQVNSVGTEVAYLVGYITITRLRPDLVVNFGSCGAICRFNNKIKVGDIYYSDQTTCFIDRSVVIPAFDKYIKGNYSNKLNQKYIEILGSLGVDRIKVGTRNSFQAEYQQLIDSGCSLVEMECASISKICSQYDVQFLALKSVSDVMDISEGWQISDRQLHDQDIGDQFEANLEGISSNLGKVVVSFIQKAQL